MNINELSTIEKTVLSALATLRISSTLPSICKAAGLSYDEVLLGTSGLYASSLIDFAETRQGVYYELTDAGRRLVSTTTN